MFRATIHGMVFASRDRHLESLESGQALLLIPDPPGQEDPKVWVHCEGGDLLGHLPMEIGEWLAPWLIEGGAVQARVIRVHGPEVPSWRRLFVEVLCVA